MNEYEDEDIDWLGACLDEIALEGLDGITIDGKAYSNLVPHF